MKADENIFRQRLALDSKMSAQILKLYVHSNFDFLNGLLVEGYSLTAISSVISQDIGKKVYPSNLGRLMKKYPQYRQNRPVKADNGATEAGWEESVVTYEPQAKVTSHMASPPGNKNKKNTSDPFGIGGLM